jgi:NADP-dependent 3-hydroxy acid dehydrogenase YdfG
MHPLEEELSSSRHLIHHPPHTLHDYKLGLVIGLDKLEDITEEAMDTMIDTNVKGLVHVTQAVLPGMRQRNRGHIINIGSVAGQQPYANGSIYCASKAAVASITRALMAETIDTAIRVSEVNPGLVETEFSVIRFRGDKEKADNVYKGLIPLNGDDIAETVIFVAGRPEHVNIAEMLVFPTNQAAATSVYRKP